jgi:hypothetical protein
MLTGVGVKVNGHHATRVKALDQTKSTQDGKQDRRKNSIK